MLMLRGGSQQSEDRWGTIHMRGENRFPAHCACVLTSTLVLALTAALASAETLLTVQLDNIGSSLTSPAGLFRWMDAADNVYAGDYQSTYEYSQASVRVDYYTDAALLHGTLTASNLKPHFAYQFKVVGDSLGDPAGNERIGYTGRWWQEEWVGGQWTGGTNLNVKGDNGLFPNPNDKTYWSRRNIPDNSPTGKHYRYTGYLVFDYFFTDENGSAVVNFQADDSYHVLWKTSQRTPEDNDGPVVSTTFAVTLPDPVDAYDTAHAETTVGIFGEWERLPKDNVTLPGGDYTASFILTEESFHGGGLQGGWASAMGAEVSFTIIPEPATAALLALSALTPLLRCIRRRRKPPP